MRTRVPLTFLGPHAMWCEVAVTFGASKCLNWVQRNWRRHMRVTAKGGLSASQLLTCKVLVCMLKPLSS